MTDNLRDAVVTASRQQRCKRGDSRLDSKRIACLGDSNTYGYSPDNPPDLRYPPEDRWPEILMEQTGWTVFNMGQNGRTIPKSKKEIARVLSNIENKLPLDLLVIMLGSNDADEYAYTSAGSIVRRMDIFLSFLKQRIPELHILLVAPPRLDIPSEYLQEVIHSLPVLYGNIAKAHDAAFISAEAWPLVLSEDKVHLSPEGHREFARRIQPAIEKQFAEQLRI